ncbi:MAG: hypothetical protein D6719_00220 [Candidatus Dadabacteria bacterium]|nr:MAG: hypothetical protein D6719_00220 [Candidatus Dadabacteria bacterium]
MEQSKALSKLREANDLLEMIEELINPGTMERLSSASWAGIRHTLRNARESLMAGHDTFAREFIGRARARASTVASKKDSISQNGPSASAAITAKSTASKGDELRSSIERYVQK